MRAAYDAAGSRPLQVLVVDDSAVARQGMGAILARHGIAVSGVSDGVSALAWMRAHRPDVVVLDLEMPRMDGLTFLRRVMASDPVPVVVCSAAGRAGTRLAMRALEEGAVEVLAKSQLDFRPGAEAGPLALAVFAAARARPRPAAPPLRPSAPERPPAPARPRAAPSLRGGARVIAVGASTGGTQAIRELLHGIPPDAPGIVIVQHMPAEFTAAFARGLNAAARVEVREAADGDAVRPGTALVAPGGRHLRLADDGAGGLRVALFDAPPVSHHRPSVDVLFHSAASAARARAVGVLLTGMGDDGADGLLAMRQAGARTFAQDEATSVVWGMPREAVLRGAAEHVLPLAALPAALLRAAAPPRAAPAA